ncbi:hypothetical protein E4U53_001499 [Claviceps sorghi]|nr:hypothetical protein E4U53_001499 [Claviceps sorghi]
MREVAPALVKRMLDYMYTGQYDEAGPGTAVEEDENLFGKLSQLGTAWPIVLHVHMMGLADMCMVDGLRQLATEKVKKLVENDITRSMVPKYLAEIYALTPRSGCIIREIAISSMRERLAKRHLEADITSQLEDAMKTVPDFTVWKEQSGSDAASTEQVRNMWLERGVDLS